MLPLKDKITPSALHKLIHLIIHSTNGMWTCLLCQTLYWLLELQQREVHSHCLGVNSLVGEKNQIQQKSPYNTWLWRWNGAFSQFGLGCVEDICYCCLLIIILLSGTTSNISFGDITPHPRSVHEVKVGAIPFLHHGHVTQPGQSEHSIFLFAVNGSGLGICPKWGQ